jgi:hypothetical protein
MKLFLTIFFSVLLANLSTAAIIKLSIEYEYNIAMREAALALDEVNRELEKKQREAAEASRIASQEREIKLEAERKSSEQNASIKRSNQEVCEFWKKQYEKTKEAYDKSMMITACKYSGQM